MLHGARLPRLFFRCAHTPLGRVEVRCVGGQAEHGQPAAGRDQLAHRGVDVMGVVVHSSRPGQSRNGRFSTGRAYAKH